VVDDTIQGLAVQTAANVAAQAGPGELVVSRTVRDLVAGSGLRFAYRGRQQLKGIEGDWPLFAVDG
jgi:class 3 adenylate cyclase